MNVHDISMPGLIFLYASRPTEPLGIPVLVELTGAPRGIAQFRGHGIAFMLKMGMLLARFILTMSTQDYSNEWPWVAGL